MSASRSAMRPFKPSFPGKGRRCDNNILKLSQRLPFPGKLGLKGRMAERDADMAAADARMTELTVLESVKQAYWDLWLTDRHLAVYTRDLELARELAAAAAGRYAVGPGGQPDVLRAEVDRTHIATAWSPCASS